MNVSFRQFKKIGVPQHIQGVIYYALLNIPYSSEKLVNICKKSIEKVAKEEIDKKMLKEYLSTSKSQTRISIDYYTSEKTIQRLHKKYVKQVYKFMQES